MTRFPRIAAAILFLLLAVRFPAGVSAQAQRVERAEHHPAWLSELVGRLDPASEPARAVEALGATPSSDQVVSTLADYFRGKPAPEWLWAIPMPAERVPGYVDERADKAVDHVITDREGEERYGDTLPWFSAEKELITLARFPHFDYLATTYFHTRDEKYARAIVRDMMDFVDNVPVSKAEGYHVQMDLRINPWNWVLLQWRVKRWIDAMHFLVDSPSLSDEEYLRATLHIWQEVEWMAPRKVLGLHNGTLGNLSALLYVAATFPEAAAAARLQQEASSFYLAFLDTAFYPREFLVELTVGYSEGTLVLCLDMLRSLPPSPLRDQAAEKLEALVDAHVGLMKPNRSLPRYGDHGIYDIRDRILRTSAALFDRPDLRRLADEPNITPEELTITSFPPESDPYYISGYYAMRDGWDEKANYLSIDAGPYGTNHHHGDKLSITVSADGAEFIVDPGTSLYRSIKPGPRIDLRPGYLHNVITIDGVDPNTGWDRHYAFDVLDNRWVTNPVYDFAEGIYEFRNNLVDAIWRRSVIFRKGEYWIMLDAVLGSGKHELESNLQFMIDTELEIRRHPGASVEAAVATAPSGAGLSVQRIANGRMNSVVVVGDTLPQPSTFLYQYPTFVDWTRGGRGWVGSFGNETPHDPTRTYPAPALVRSGSVDFPFYDVHVMTPSKGGLLKTPRVSWLVAPEATNDGHLRLQIDHDAGVVDVLDWRPSRWTSPTQPLKDDSGFWYRAKDGEIVEVMIMNTANVLALTDDESLSIRFDGPFEGVVRRRDDGSWSLFPDTYLKAVPRVEEFVIDYGENNRTFAFSPDAVPKPGAWIPLVER